MDNLTFIAKLVEFLAWPVASLLVVVFLRKQISDLLPHVKKFKAGPIEAEFERELKELRATAPVDSQSAPVQDQLTPERQVLLQLVQVSPRSAVLEAWRGIESSAVRLVQEKGIYVPEREARSPLAMMRAIAQGNHLSSEDIALYHDLRALRNQAAHLDDFNPSAEAAISYLELASRLRQSLKRATNAG